MAKRKGFTLVEMLFVIAIIIVLLGIIIPVFLNKLEEARDATDAANIRAQYAEVMADAIMNDGDISGYRDRVVLLQKTNGFQNEELKKNVLSLFDKVEGNVDKEPKKNGIAYVKYQDGERVLVFSEEGYVLYEEDLLLKAKEFYGMLNDQGLAEKDIDFKWPNRPSWDVSEVPCIGKAIIENADNKQIVAGLSALSYGSASKKYYVNAKSVVGDDELKTYLAENSGIADLYEEIGKCRYVIQTKANLSEPESKKTYKAYQYLIAECSKIEGGAPEYLVLGVREGVLAWGKKWTNNSKTYTVDFDEWIPVPQINNSK